MKQINLLSRARVRSKHQSEEALTCVFNCSLVIAGLCGMLWLTAATVYLGVTATRQSNDVVLDNGFGPCCSSSVFIKAMAAEISLTYKEDENYEAECHRILGEALNTKARVSFPAYLFSPHTVRHQCRGRVCRGLHRKRAAAVPDTQPHIVLPFLSFNLCLPMQEPVMSQSPLSYGKLLMNCQT